MPLGKEPWFFSHAVIPEAWPEYVAQFPQWDSYKAVGDDSTTYTAHQCVNQASARLAEHYPDLKVLLIARDPVDRIESSLREMQHSNHLFGEPSPLNLDDALDNHEQLLADSCYFTQSQPYRDLFPAEHIKVVFLEDLDHNPSEVLRECAEFLGVDPSLFPSDVGQSRLNTGNTKYRDTALLRHMRYHRLTRRAVAWRGDQRQETLLRRVGLRRPARSAVEWSPTARQRVRDIVRPDAEQFLATYSPGRVWPRLMEMSESA